MATADVERVVQGALMEVEKKLHRQLPGINTRSQQCHVENMIWTFPILGMFAIFLFFLSTSDLQSHSNSVLFCFDFSLEGRQSTGVVGPSSEAAQTKHASIEMELQVGFPFCTHCILMFFLPRIVHYLHLILIVWGQMCMCFFSILIINY